MGGGVTAERAFVSHGVPIGVRTNEPALLERIPDCFPPGWRESPSATVDAWYSIVRAPLEGGARVVYRLYENDAMLGEGFRLAPLLDCMDTAIRLQVGRGSPERIFVHAGAVGWKGHGIVIPGRSGVGKTSLVAALVSAGAIYYSDDYAVFDVRGMLHPYNRRLSFRQGEHRRVRRSAVTDLGGREATEPLPVALVVHTAYRPGARWVPHTISSGQAAMALFANALAARERPAFALSVLSRTVLHAIALEGDREESETAAAAILDYADRIHHSPQSTTP